jgi:hypothetical protein
MKFKKPEDLAALNEKALEKALNDALDEYSELVKIDDTKITDEQLADMEALKDSITEIKAEKVNRTNAEAERAERIAKAKEPIAEDGDDDEDKSDDDAEDGDDEEAEEEGDDDDSEEEEDEEPAESKKEPVLASGKRKVTRSASRRARKPAADADEEPEKPKVSLVAKADVSGFASGQALDMDGLTQAYMARLKGFPGKSSRTKQVLKHGFATMTKPGYEQFAQFDIDVRDSQEVAWSNLMKASRQENAVGGSLTAAGGWCAPSENFYDLCQWETATGALDLPEITVRRGGINFTKGPDFSDIYANTGFTQTEADAIAGEVKDFLEVECPDWTEVRLDAIGYGVKAPILTGSPAGFPELIRRYLEGALVAHYHRVNAYVINKVLGFLGAEVNFAEAGSGTGDLLHAIEIAAMRLRYKYRLGENATLEAMFPMWALAAIRTDLAYRTGVDSFLGVTDAQVRSWFTLRGIRPQFVYDWAGQDLLGTEEAFPVVLQFGIWPAGAFVKGTNNVIELDAIYDSTEIETNTYTAAFFEEAILVANTCGDGDLWQVNMNYFGRTGAAQVGGIEAS